MVDVDASEQPEQFAVEKFAGDYTKAELDPLLHKDWIASDGKNFYTTEKFPGNVLTHFLLIPADKSFSVLSSIHREYCGGSGYLISIRLPERSLLTANFAYTVANLIIRKGLPLRCHDAPWTSLWQTSCNRNA
jgi:hypothetical protein